jgi:hypothetical protein
MPEDNNPGSLDQNSPSIQNHSDPNRFVAYVWHKITLYDPDKKEEFEKFLIGQLLPSINTTGQPLDKHALLDGTEGYACLSFLAYAVHHTPLPVWLSEQVEELTKALRGGLSAFGEVASPEFYYEVAAWRQKLGI